MENHREVQTEAVPEDDGGFHDYTIATALEKLIASIENSLRHVLTKDLPRHYELNSSLTAGSHLPATFVAKLPNRFPFRSESYSLSLHLPAAPVSPVLRHRWALQDQPHKLQEWFLPGACLVLSPDSYSGRVLGEEEAHTLLSAGAAALSHLKLQWPLYIPVHDALRDAYRGVAFSFPQGCVVRLESDSVHGRNLPREFKSLSGQLAGFASRLKWHAPSAAAICADIAAAAAELHNHEGALEHLEQRSSSGGAGFGLPGHRMSDQSLASAAEALSLSTNTTTDDSTCLPEALAIRWSTRRCYQLPPLLGLSADGPPSSSTSNWDAETSSVSAQSQLSSSEMELLIDTWDEEAVWRPWAAEDDPLSGLEIDALWDYWVGKSGTDGESSKSNDGARVHGGLRLRPVGSVSKGGDGENKADSVDIVAMAREGSSSTTIMSASAWRIAALRRDYVPDDGRRPLIMMQAVDQKRRFLRLQSIISIPEESFATLAPPQDALPGAASFAGMLNAMADQALLISKATDTSDLSSDEWWLQQGNYVPPTAPSYVLQDAIRDLFQAPSLPVWPGTGVHGGPVLGYEVNSTTTSDIGRDSGSSGSDFKSYPVGKAAPLSSLATRLALHAMRLGNPRAVAMLWSRFVRELRFAHWEAGVPLTRTGRRSSSKQQEGVPSGQQQQQQQQPLSNSSGEGAKRAQSGSAEAPDLRHCLLHQKLELLDICIRAQREERNSGSNQEESLLQRNESSGDESYLSAEDDADKESSNRADVAAWSAAWEAWEDDVTEALKQRSSPLKTPRSTSKSLQNTAISAVDVENQDPVAPEGIAGEMDICLLDDPERKINIPITQQSPPVTEDALEELTHTAGHGALLLSDMQAFKAANPGCRFEDFVRWHSPRDWVVVESRNKDSGTADGAEVYGLSGRMANREGTWYKLWRAAKPIAATKQRPLFQAALEGERILHFLETLPPAAVHAELMALGFAAGVELLSRAPSAMLPAVAAELARLKQIGNSWLGPDGIAAVDTSFDPVPTVDTEELSTSAASDTDGDDSGGIQVGPTMAASPALHAMLHSGLSMRRMKTLVQVMGCVEQCVAAGQSILQRLSPADDEASDKMAVVLPEAAVFSFKTANELIIAALQHGTGTLQQRSGTDTDDSQVLYGAMAELNRGDVQILSMLAGGGGGGGGGEVPVRQDNKLRGHQWSPKPFCTEWSLEICDPSVLRDASAASDLKKKDGNRNLAPDFDKQNLQAPLHRFFVRQLPAELRIATVITSELS